jgi:hypothetical protein
MNGGDRNWMSFAYAALELACLGWLSTQRTYGQTEDRSPMGLIRFLTYQSADRPRLPVMTFSCGISANSLADLAAVDALVMQGAAALPALNDAINSMEQSGQKSPFVRNFRWLLFAYAKIQGPTAVPHLSALSTNSYLTQDFGFAIDQAIALSLGLTSYVVQSQPPLPIIRCTGLQPRDALDQLILGWERDDRSWMEASLGPASMSALTALLNGRSWTEFRSEFWPAKSESSVSVGYRFVVPSAWSEPEMSLEFARIGQIVPEPPTLETHFTNRAGGGCGSAAITFARTQTPPSPVTSAFQVNQPDIGGLLRLIGSCAAQ